MFFFLILIVVIRLFFFPFYSNYFSGSTPFFMGTIAEDNTADSSEGGSAGEGKEGGVGSDQFAIFDRLLDATLSVNFSGTVLYANQAVEDVCDFILFYFNIKEEEEEEEEEEEGGEEEDIL
jgi:hypothetical protein